MRKLSLDFVIHGQKVPLAGGVHAKGVAAGTCAAMALQETHLSLPSSSAQNVLTTLPACVVFKAGSNTPSHCRNAIAGSGEAWGSAFTMAPRTASFNASPLQGRGKVELNKLPKLQSAAHHLHGGALMTA